MKKSKFNKSQTSSINSQSESEKPMPILDHFKELRKRLLISCLVLFIAFVVGFVFSNNLFDFLVQPLQDQWGDDPARGMIFTALQEKFFTDIKLSFFFAVFIGFPLMASQIWIFISPALYKKEKLALLPFLISTPLLFWMGAAFVYYFVMPAAWGFFLGYEQLPIAGQSNVLLIQLQPKVSEYLNLTIGLILAFGFSFELPVLLSLLVKVRIIKVSSLKRNRRVAIVIAFVLAAVLTPPDPVSQIFLALPLIILYECSIWFGVWIEKDRKQND